jgi:hypothetical protein
MVYDVNLTLEIYRTAVGANEQDFCTLLWKLLKSRERTRHALRFVGIADLVEIYNEHRDGHGAHAVSSHSLSS